MCFWEAIDWGNDALWFPQFFEIKQIILTILLQVDALHESLITRA